VFVIKNISIKAVNFTVFRRLIVGIIKKHSKIFKWKSIKEDMTAGK
jgi:hypothetical protein